MPWRWAPIAYKLAYLSDNSPARLSFADAYQVKDCVRVSQKILVTFDSITVEAAPDEVGSGGARVRVKLSLLPI